MKEFATLFSALETSNKTNDKLHALVDYFTRAPEKDKLWFLALMTGKRPKRPVKTTMMREWAMQVADIPEWLFLECYSNVGDLGETLSLILPPPSKTTNLTLEQWMNEIIRLNDQEPDKQKEFVLEAWDSLEPTGRLIFNKLIGGSFRVGVSSKLLINALSKYAGREPSALMHSIMGNWNIESVSFSDLIEGTHINEDNSKPYPFCLAYPLDKELTELGEPDQWQAEYKWDGIRGQIIKRNNEVFIWSRGEELVTSQFPELEQAAANLEGDFVIDGEILVVKDEKVLNFQELQKRLNRKNVTRKMLDQIPAAFYAYDLLEYNQEDQRQKSLIERRRRLIELVEKNEFIKMPPNICYQEWSELVEVRRKSREVNSEGLMLKLKDSPYHSGRKRGDWWKWKVDPLTIDAVMIYAQKGSGRRSAWYTDYTFAIRDGEKLVTIAKAYSGLTDKEIEEINRFVKNNSIEKFGPVRTVVPELVFEIAFEGIAFSKRHKSGIALRFPRISRWRKDKTVDEIDTIETVRALINE